MEDNIALNSEDLDTFSSAIRTRILDSIAFKPKTPSDISSELGSSQSTVTEHLNSLIANGFVIKLLGSNEKYVFYTLSEKGKGVVHSFKKTRIMLYISILLIALGTVFNVLRYTNVFGVYSYLSAMITGPQAVDQALSLIYYTYWVAILVGAAGVAFYVLKLRRLGNSLFLGCSYY